LTESVGVRAIALTIVGLMQGMGSLGATLHDPDDLVATTVVLRRLLLSNRTDEAARSQQRSRIRRSASTTSDIDVSGRRRCVRVRDPVCEVADRTSVEARFGLSECKSHGAGRRCDVLVGAWSRDSDGIARPGALATALDHVLGEALLIHSPQ